MLKTSKRIRLTAVPMANAAEYHSHPRCELTQVLINKQLGFVAWCGDYIGAQEAAQQAADNAAKTLPPNWMVTADIGGKVAPVSACTVS